MIRQCLIVSALFLLSCEPPKKKVTVPTYSQVFSKSCSAGSVQVSRKQAVSVKTPLKPGEAVIINGQVRGGSPCLSNSGFSFRCEGIVYVDTNRAFVCQSGYITPTNPGTLYSQTNVYQNPYPHTRASPSHYAANKIHIQSGKVILYQNGTELFVTLEFTNPLLPAQMRGNQCTPASGGHFSFNPYFAGNQCCAASYRCSGI